MSCPIILRKTTSDGRVTPGYRCRRLCQHLPRPPPPSTVPRHSRERQAWSAVLVDIAAAKCPREIIFRRLTARGEAVFLLKRACECRRSPRARRPQSSMVQQAVRQREPARIGLGGCRHPYSFVRQRAEACRQRRLAIMPAHPVRDAPSAARPRDRAPVDEAGEPVTGLDQRFGQHRPNSSDSGMK